MSILRNDNESNYASGRKHFKDVIKNQGTADALIFLAGEEDFNNGSVLFVEESQEAIFMKNGLIEGILPPGRHVLSTENYPFLTRLKSLISGGVSVYNCKIFFVKKSMVKELFWGTTSPIQVRDQKLGIQTELGARGTYKVHIANARIFLIKLVGSNMKTFQENELIDFFRGQFLAYIKSTIAQVITNSKQEILGIQAHQIELASQVAVYLAHKLYEYGLELDDFSIESIDIVNDENRKNIEAAHGEKVIMETLGIERYADKVGYDALKSMTNNSNYSGTASATAGMGAGMLAGEWAYQMMAGMRNQLCNTQNERNSPTSNIPQNCVQEIEKDNKQQLGEDKLKQLKRLLDQELISQEKYDAAVDEVLKNIISS